MSDITKEFLLTCLRNELVPENPRTDLLGIAGLLQYRMNKNLRHPDSIYLKYDSAKKRYVGISDTACYFERIYGIDPQKIGSSDTIFNCWSFLNRFLRGATSKKWVNEEEALEHLDELFAGYDSIRAKLDTLANYHHSLANFMPAPWGFNGTPRRDGKGNFNRDNDMPDIYFKRAEYDFPRMHAWIYDHMEEFSLQFFKEYNSGLEDGYAKNPVEVTNEMELSRYEQSIADAIAELEKRAERLIQRMNR